MVGNAAARASVFAVEQFLNVMNVATKAQVAVRAFLAAVEWVRLGTGLIKVIVCGALELGLDQLIDKLIAEHLSDYLPSELTGKFEEACLAVQTW
jgi:hypothetical protein